jgi:uncharacterized cupredoxin-like copper-binding protein
MNRARGLLGILLVSALAVACIPAQPTGPAAAKPTSSVQAVEVKATDSLKFDPATLTVKKGSPVRVTLTNGTVLEHDWVVDSLEGKKVDIHTDPKTNGTADFTPTAAGTYQFYCSIPGHREAGMTGTLTVQ